MSNNCFPFSRHFFSSNPLHYCYRTLEKFASAKKALSATSYTNPSLQTQHTKARKLDLVYTQPKEKKRKEKCQHWTWALTRHDSFGTVSGHTINTAVKWKNQRKKIFKAKTSRATHYSIVQRKHGGCGLPAHTRVLHSDTVHIQKTFTRLFSEFAYMCYE